MTDARTSTGRGGGAFEPLREPLYRSVWSASLLSNFGILILGVGAAWEMTRLTGNPALVALVQSALMLPMMLVSVPAGAIADMFDRRKVALAGLGFACLCAAMLATLAWFGMTRPWLLLMFCALIGTGGALYGPAWQASVREQVRPEHLPAAIALASISYNIARCFGPAVGGVVVLLAGARAAFGTNAFCYLPLITVFLLWRRPPVPSRLPPERIDRAIVAGARYVFHSPPTRVVMIRALLIGLAGASVSALTPLVARDLLRGSADLYGLLLGAYGVGAVFGALLIGRARARFDNEQIVRIASVAAGLMAIAIGSSSTLLLTVPAMAVSGAAWMLLAAMLNLSVQLSVPRWVTARALSWYQSALTGGIAIGAWCWGSVAEGAGLRQALIISGVTMALATALAGLVLRLPRIASDENQPVELSNEPEVALALTMRSGPIVIEIEYQVDPEQARPFHAAMLQLQRARQRNGAFDWSLARDIADPALWIERYHCPTWTDYHRLRSRLTTSDLALHEAVSAFRRPGSQLRVRRMLERPFGSVRWRADSPDPSTEPIPAYAP